MDSNQLPACYDSIADTLRHSLRVGELVGEVVKELVERSTQHDRSKTEPPEKAAFDRAATRLAGLTYGSPEYKASLSDLGPALEHHYAHNRHHPEHFPDGIAGMTLVDVVEMLADWKAATERHTDGDLARSLEVQRDRFGICDQLWTVLWNTAVWYGWVNPHQGNLDE